MHGRLVPSKHSSSYFWAREFDGSVKKENIYSRQTVDSWQHRDSSWWAEMYWVLYNPGQTQAMWISINSVTGMKTDNSPAITSNLSADAMQRATEPNTSCVIRQSLGSSTNCNTHTWNQMPIINIDVIHTFSVATGSKQKFQTEHVSWSNSHT